MANGDAWNQGWATGQRLEEGAKEHKRSRQEQLQDEQRQQKLAVYADLHHSGRISTPELAHAIEDIYHDAEPEKKMSMLGRLLQRKKAREQHDEFLQGKQQRGAEEQSILANAKPLKAVQDEAQQRQLELEKAKGEAKAPTRRYVSPDGKESQWFRSGDEPEGWIAVAGSGKPAPEVKPLEAGGVPYGVQASDGQTFLANQMNDPNTPPQVKQVWSTIQSAMKQKRDDAEKKQAEEDERQIRGLKAIADRMGRSEEFQEKMADYRSKETEWRGLDKQARDAEEAAQLYTAAKSMPGNKSAFDTSLITDYTSILAKGGRKTQAEINFAQKIGGIEDQLDKKVTQFSSGELPDEMRALYVDYLATRAKSLREEADKAKPEPPNVGGGKSGPGPKSDGVKVFKVGNDTYKIPANKVAAFKKKYPNATESN